MFRFGMKSDTIQFWLLIFTGLGFLMGAAGLADARYAKSDKVKQLSWEVHALYLSLPDEKRIKLEREREQYEMSQGQ